MDGAGPVGPGGQGLRPLPRSTIRPAKRRARSWSTRSSGFSSSSCPRRRCATAWRSGTRPMAGPATARVDRKAEWPDWNPPAEMIARWPHVHKTAGGPDEPARRPRALPLRGQQGHALPHPRHQRAGEDRSGRLLRLHPDAQHRRDRPLQPRPARGQGRHQVEGGASPRSTTTISGGTPNRTGAMLVPSPPETMRWRPFSTTCP